MYNLIKRDLILQKKQLLLYFPFIILFVAMEKSPALIYLVSSIMIPFNAYAYDEKAETNILLNSLPYTRKEIVTARYLGAIIFMIISILFTNLFLILFNQSFAFKDIAIGSGLFILFAALAFPLFYILKPGHISTVIMISFLVLAFIGPSIFTFVINKLSFISTLVNSLSTLTAFTVGTLIVLLTYAISWFFTVNVYQRKVF